MVFKLRMVNGSKVGTKFVLWKSPFVIGRHAECDLRISSPQISLHHCAVILRKDDDVWIRDLQSTNGTLVEGDLVANECRLRVGTRIQVGPAIMELERFDDSAAILGVADAGEYETTEAHVPVGMGEFPKTQRLPKSDPRGG